MLRLSKKTDYALLALQYLAREAPPAGASARAIAERYDIPVDLLAKILQHLARLGFVVAQKGAHGGYHLARASSGISLAEVAQAIDGPFAITTCARSAALCDQFARCPVRDPLWRIANRILAVLEATTLADMTEANGSVPLVLIKGGPGGSVPVAAT